MELSSGFTSFCLSQVSLQVGIETYPPLARIENVTQTFCDLSIPPFSSQLWVLIYLNGDMGMRTLFTFGLLSAIAFSGVAVGQDDVVKQIDKIAEKTAKTVDENPVSIVDLNDEPAPSDAEIDTARHESALHVESTQTVATASDQVIDQGVIYPENVLIQDCCCQSGLIAPVVYQQPLVEGLVTGENEISLEGALEGSIEAEPVADAASSVVESPITDSASNESAPVYADAGVVTEGAPITVQGDPIVTGTPSCGCNQGAAPAVVPTEGLISSSPVSYQSAAPVIYSSPAPAAAPCCPPARRGFFRRLMGR